MFQLLILNRKLLAGKGYKVQPLKARPFFHLILQLLKFVFRPLNSHGFIVCHKVSLPSSQSHGRFFISHGFTNFKSIFSRTHNFLRKKTRQHNSLSKNIVALSFTYKRINNSVIFDSETSTRSSPGNDCPVNYQNFYEKHQSNKKCSFQG